MKQRNNTLIRFYMAEYLSGPDGCLHHPNMTRNRGGFCRDEFWRGFDGHRSMSDPSSEGRCAWKAGKLIAKTNKE